VRAVPSDWLDELESTLAGSDVADAVVTVAFVAGREVPVGLEELGAATRRALLVLASGGDPNRGLDLEGPAVERLADELDAPERRAALEAGLRALATGAGARPHVAETAHALLAAPERAWRAYACAVLAESLSG
jgi:hypothetical protein